MTSTLCIVVTLVACIGTLCKAQTLNCYKCSEDNNPANTDCLNAVTDITDEESCEGSCFVDGFQSGGYANLSDFSKYWTISRGCVPDCTQSENCLNKDWGYCRKCCTGDKCNTGNPNGSNIIKASFLMALFVAMVAKWLK